ncbi:MAG: YHS domain-containing protein [Pseudomonadota bacterium]|nr:YHS domain-containing protein [Pseudomonadota bacterium]
MKPLTPPFAERVRDPVCGMEIDPAYSKATAEHDGETLSFCSARCHAEFVKEPGRYAQIGVSPPASPITTPPRSARPAKPGETGLSPELLDMRRRLVGSVALTLPLLPLALSGMLPGQPLQRLIPAGVDAWIQLALATPVVLWGGWPSFVRGAPSATNRSPNLFTLLSLGIGMAWGYSIFATLLPGALPEAFRGQHGRLPLYFFAAAVLTTLGLVGQVLPRRSQR